MRFTTIGLTITLVLGLFAGSLPAKEQQVGKMPRIGYLRHLTGPNETDAAFFQALRDLGWIEGQNIAFEYRWAAGRRDRFLALAYV